MTQPPGGPSDPAQPDQPAYPPYPQPPAYPPVTPPPVGNQPPGYPPPYPPPTGAYGYPGTPPQYGYPGTPPQYGYPATPGAYPPPAGNNGMATASLITGILGCTGIGSLLAIVFGVIGLTQIRQRGGQGRGMAIAGIILGAVWIVVLVISIALSGVKRDSHGNITKGGDMSVFSLKVGDCVKQFDALKDMGKWSGDQVKYDKLPVVPCTDPHRAEVFAVFTLSGDKLPDDDTISSQAEQCSSALSDYASQSIAEDSSITIRYLYPNADAWKRHDRSLVCIAEFTSERTSSIKHTI